ncbi:sperm receptor for egg jelly [Aplysia californica]|uniref:Sperm receptor for egg jelly n=1 Tax=Aplysia californica TaxID=6500 RepID=A0ABM1A210_APLCA|nr:sperm receptor for egg jelly [Aplysia californica]
MYGQGDLTRTNYQTPIISQDPEEEFKMESERNDRAEVRESLIESISKLPTQSVISIQQVISFYAEATVYGDEISQDSQETVMEALENMTLFMTDPESVDKVPSEDLEVAMENGIAAIGGIMDAAGNNGYRGTLKELEEAEEDEEWFVYDSSLNALGGEDDMSSAGTFDEAMKIHTARIHKIRQAKTAERVRQRVIRTLDAQAKVFSRYSVPGQTLLMRSVKMKVIMEKTDVQRLIGKTLNPPGSTGGVTLPDNAFIGGDPEETVVASVTQSTNHPLKYSDKAKGISPSSNFISINLYDDNNSKMTVSGLVEPVKIVVPLDANMPKPSYIEMDPIISKWTNLMLLVANINRSQSAIHLDFKDIEGRQFLLVVKKGKPAKIAVDRADDECDAVYLVPSSLSSTDPDRYRFYLSNNQLGNFVGQLSIGMRELNTTEYGMDISAGCASLPRYENGSDYFQGNFSLRQYVTQCLAISDSANDWSTDGCEVSKETNDSNNVCLCNHLTTFAGGWVVVPNTIDWSYVFANADFLSNPTIYITVMLTAVLYITAAIYARYKDKKMTEQLGIAPLADNDPKDKYFYEVLVCTGMRRNAGTNSQVCFILSGEDDETDVRAFSDSKRKIFRRGQVDGFLMAVPRHVDRVIPVAGREQLSDFSYQFGERSKKNLADGHLWFSVVARPPQSRFTCLQVRLI